MINKINITFIIFIICCSFVLMDYSINGYNKKYSLHGSAFKISNTEDKDTHNKPPKEAIKTIDNVLSDKIIEGLEKKYSISNTKEIDNLFGVIKTEELVYQDVKNLFRIYKISGDLYTGIKANFLSLTKRSDSININETNSYGDKSFYFNDFNKNDTAFLVILKNNTVYGLEYKKDNHDIIKKLIDLL